jgi:hypothetical protein
MNGLRIKQKHVSAEIAEIAEEITRGVLGGLCDLCG